MKKILFVFLLSFKAMAITPPNQTVIDQYVSIALSNSAEAIRGDSNQAKWSCHFPVIHKSLEYSYGKDVKEASQRLQILCLKSQCQALLDQVAKKEEEVIKMPDSDFRDILEFMGKSKEEIEVIMQSRSSMTKTKTVFNCENSAYFRMTAIDSCFTIPVECGEVEL